MDFDLRLKAISKLATSETEAIIVGTILRFVTGGHHTRLDVTEGEVRFRRRHRRIRSCPGLSRRLAIIACQPPVHMETI